MKSQTDGFSEMLNALNKTTQCHISKHCIGYNDIKRGTVHVFGFCVQSFAQYCRQLLRLNVIAGQYKEPLQALPLSHAPYNQSYVSDGII